MKMGESSNSARGKVARTPRKTTFTRSMKIPCSYFLEDRCPVLNSVFLY